MKCIFLYGYFASTFHVQFESKMKDCEEKGCQLFMRGHGSSGLEIAQFHIFNLSIEATVKGEIASMDPQSYIGDII
jgi:hypothetical protein